MKWDSPHKTAYFIPEKSGFFIPAVRPPTVPNGTARLRISVQCNHTREDLDGLCRALAELIN